MNKQTLDVVIIAAITIVSTLFLGWMATAVNTGDGGDPSWFTVTCAISSLCVLTLGGVLVGRRIAGLDQ